MSFFRWTAPIFKWSRHRWSEDDFRRIAGYLRPYVSSGGLLLDLGGGTGDLGLGVGRVLETEVIVADITPQMLRRVSPHPSMSVRLTAAETLPFPSGHFDALLCSDAFHHFRDQGAAAREMCRVVRTGGGVLILELRPTGWGRLLVLGERMLGEPAAFRRPGELQDLLSTCGISGTILEQGPLSYLFVGSKVKEDDDT
jgi:demethylmenaquinone methyltransferase/2-methoxy-6-polyprenyl-1,4-benzoquinol methylase